MQGSRDTIKHHFTTVPPPGAALPAGSGPDSLHYSFDFAQQVHYPHNPLQPGPMYFKTARKCAVFGVFFHAHDICWWKTPPESPDLNSIENLWHELKEHLRREIKPHTKEELVDGIVHFWKTVTPAKCTRYIRYLRKVMPRVIQEQGAATGY